MRIDTLTPRLQELSGSAAQRPDPSIADAFTSALQHAVGEVEQLQQNSAAAQEAYARGEPVELHDVLIRIEEAELAFKTMMEVRNKLIGAYQEIMRMGSGN